MWSPATRLDGLRYSCVLERGDYGGVELGLGLEGASSEQRQLITNLAKVAIAQI